MDHALVQHLTKPRPLVAALFSIVLAGCIGAKGNDRHPPPPAHRTIAYVSPTGVDTAVGDKAAPFRTIAKALAGDFDQIILMKGAYDEERIDIARTVLIEGEGSVVRGHVFVSANGVTLRRLSMGGGLAAHFVQNLIVDNATISAGAKDDTVSLTRSSASFAHVKLSCGGISCLQATTATVSIEDAVAIGIDETKRVLRFEMSKARLERCRLEKSSVAHLQVSDSSDVEVSDVRMIGGSSGVIAAQGAKLTATNLIVEGASKMSLIGQRAKLRIDGGILGSTLDQTVGLSGADAVFRGTIFESSPKGVISVVDHLVSRSVVRIEGGEIRHGRAAGIGIASGVVTIAGVRFVGDPTATEEGYDAITATGVDSRVIVESATFEAPGAFGVAFHSDASGSVTATVTRPLLGGVLVEDVAAEPIAISRSVVKGCVQGSGVVVQGAVKVTMDRLRVEGCKESGVLAGEKANVVISNSSLVSNAMYGCAAFGGASVDLSGTLIKGSKFATFASCGDGARIEDKGNNRLEGSVSACP